MLKKYNNALSDFEMTTLQTWFSEAFTATGFELKFAFDHAHYDIEQDCCRIAHKLKTSHDTDSKIYAMERTLVPTDQKHKIGAFINRISGKDFDFFKNDKMYYVRVNMPSGPHIDELHRKNDYFSSKGFTYLIPLTYSSNIATVAWKNLYDKSSDMEEDKMHYLRKIQPTAEPKEYPDDIKAMLSHCINVIDTWELENHVTWEKGSLIEFSAGQVHCSSNFRPYHEYKDYVLWHIY
jgi:hypothetical protein